MLIALCLAFGAARPISAEAPVVPAKPLTPQELVSKYAQEAGVDQKIAHYVADAESGYQPRKIGDTDILCHNKRSPYDGQEVYARGVFQITRCYHPEVSDMQAFDPDFNISWGIHQIAQGEKKCRAEFSTCDRYYRVLK